MTTSLTSTNPWTGSAHSHVAITTAEQIAIHCTAAHTAWSPWQTDHQQRRAALQRFATIIADARARIITFLCEEAGKNTIDAAAEADLLVKKITISLDAGLARTPVTITDSTEPQTMWRARGVAAVLGPFNFPLHLLHGLIVPALAVGCTVVAKPSEYCPGLGQLYAELLRAAQLQDVCHIIFGGADTAQTLITNPHIRTVAAVGGKHMGAALAATLAARPDVVLALELGGVNPAVVLNDADIPSAATAIADGAWRMAGQRCTATRHLHVPRHLLTPMVDALKTERQHWMPDGTPTGANGALIHKRAHQQVLDLITTFPQGLCLVAGDPQRRFAKSTCIEPVIAVVENHQVRATTHYSEEHFGPLLIVDPYDDLDDCLNHLARNPYRLAASIFTADHQRFLSIAQKLPYGQVNHNRPTAGARSDMPFGGIGAAGNGHPAAVAAGAIFADECVVW